MTAARTGLPREPRLQALRWWVREHRLPVIGWLLVLLVVAAPLVAWRAGAWDPSPVAQPKTSFGVDGGNLVERGALGPGVEIGAVGEDLTRTFIIKRAGATEPQPAVIFLHGFGSSLIAGYEGWIEHLARQGLTVIFPSWQQPPFPTDGTQNPRFNMFEGVRLAVEAVPVQEDKIATLGLSAGGALAFDYAALGTKLDGIPKARLVYSVYPGRAFPGEEKIQLPIPPIGGMEPDTMVVSVVSRKDRDAGTKWGRQQYEAMAPRGDAMRRLTYVTAPGLGGHYAPGKVDRDARRVFWNPFDKLLRTHLGAELDVDEAALAATREGRIAKQEVIDDALFRKRVIEGKPATDPGDPQGVAPYIP